MLSLKMKLLRWRRRMLTETRDVSVDANDEVKTACDGERDCNGEERCV